MKNSTFQDLQTSMRRKVPATFATTSTTVLDAGPGRSFVGIEIPAALAAGDLTFAGAIDENLALGEDPAATYPVSAVQTGADASVAAFTVVIAGTETGLIPLDVRAFNPYRYLVITSTVSQAGKVVNGISKPV